MECGFPPRQELTSSSGSATVQAFLGRNASQTSAAGCTARPIGSKVFLPPKDVVKLVQRFGWGVFLAAAGLMLALMLAVGSVLILRSRRPLVAGEPGEQPAVVAVPVSQQRSEDVVSSPAVADTLTNGHVDGQQIEPPAPTPDAPALPAEPPHVAPAEARPAEAVPAPPEAQPDVVMPEAVPADVLTEQVPPVTALAEDVVSAAPIPDVVKPSSTDRRRVRWSVPRVSDATDPNATEPPAEPPSPAEPRVEEAPPTVTTPAPTASTPGWAAAGRRAAARAAAQRPSGRCSTTATGRAGRCSTTTTGISRPQKTERTESQSGAGRSPLDPHPSGRYVGCRPGRRGRAGGRGLRRVDLTAVTREWSRQEREQPPEAAAPAQAYGAACFGRPGAGA